MITAICLSLDHALQFYTMIQKSISQEVLLMVMHLVEVHKLASELPKEVLLSGSASTTSGFLNQFLQSSMEWLQVKLQ